MSTIGALTEMTAITNRCVFRKDIELTTEFAPKKSYAAKKGEVAIFYGRCKGQRLEGKCCVVIPNVAQFLVAAEDIQTLAERWGSPIF